MNDRKHEAFACTSLDSHETHQSKPIFFYGEIMNALGIFIGCFLIVMNCRAASIFDPQFYQNWEVNWGQHRLSPEQKRALTKLISESRTMVDPGAQVITRPIKLDQLTKAGKAFFTTQSVFTPLLPHGETWIWNQSRAKQEIKLAKMKIIFAKLSPRKYIDARQAPMHKIWTFIIENSNDSSANINFIWCERAHNVTDFINLGESDAKEQLCLEGLEKLSEFVPEARVLGTEILESDRESTLNPFLETFNDADLEFWQELNSMDDYSDCRLEDYPDVTLDDLQFLLPDITVQCAIGLGWVVISDNNGEKTFTPCSQ